MNEYTIVEPTKRKPRFLRFFDSASEMGVVAGRLRGAEFGRQWPGRSGHHSHEIGVERPLGLDHVEHGPGIAHRGFDLGPVANDARVGHQPLAVALVERGHGRRLKSRERRPETVALAQDGQPRQAGLERLERKHLEQPRVVSFGRAPLVVVIRDKEWV